MSEFTPTLSHFRAVYGAMCADWCRDGSLAEFDRFIAKVKADALREAGAAVMGKRLETETEAGNWLDERADQIEREA